MYASSLICIIVSDQNGVSGHVLYTNVLYMLEYESCTCWWSDKSALLEVNSKEDGSEYCVFIGTMIRINNLASLP